MQALRTLKLQDFVEMKSLLKPPVLIRITMDAVCIMMDRKPKKTAEVSIFFLFFFLQKIKKQ